MLSFVPEIESITKWFALCYRIEVDSMSGFARYERVAFPAAGSPAEQDARLMFGLEACAAVSNDLLAEERKRREKQAAKTKVKKR